MRPIAGNVHFIMLSLLRLCVNLTDAICVPGYFLKVRVRIGMGI